MSDRADGGTVVIGVGNPIMADDGLGLAVLEVLRDGWSFEPPIELVDGGTWGVTLLPYIEDAHRLMILDAINAKQEPGTLVVVERADLPRRFRAKLSPHQVDLHDVLALAELRGRLPEDTVAMGLQPKLVEMATELSPALQGCLGVVVDAAIDRLAQWGHEATRASGAYA